MTKLNFRFVPVPTEAVEHEEVSPAAALLLGVMHNHSEGFKVTKTYIMDLLDIKERTWRTLTGQLYGAGFLVYTQEDGEVAYHTSASPRTINEWLAYLNERVDLSRVSNASPKELKGGIDVFVRGGNVQKGRGVTYKKDVHNKTNSFQTKEEDPPSLPKQETTPQSAGVLLAGCGVLEKLGSYPDHYIPMYDAVMQVCQESTNARRKVLGNVTKAVVAIEDLVGMEADPQKIVAAFAQGGSFWTAHWMGKKMVAEGNTRLFPGHISTAYPDLGSSSVKEKIVVVGGIEIKVKE